MAHVYIPFFKSMEEVSEYWKSVRVSYRILRWEGNKMRA